MNFQHFHMITSEQHVSDEGCNPSKPKEGGSRSVRFSNNPPKVIFVEPWKEEEKRERYYGREDVVKMTEECRDTVLAARDDQLDAKSQCIRGLEKYLEGATHPNEARAATLSVLREFQRQKDLGLRYPYLLSSEYRNFTERARISAINDAQMDAFVAGASSKKKVFRVDVNKKSDVTVAPQQSPVETRRSIIGWYRACRPIRGVGNASMNTVQENAKTCPEQSCIA